LNIYTFFSEIIWFLFKLSEWSRLYWLGFNITRITLYFGNFDDMNLNISLLNFISFCWNGYPTMLNIILLFFFIIQIN